MNPVRDCWESPDGSVLLLLGDVLDRLRDLPDESVHCVVTSPPYWGLRDYGTATWEGGDEECDHKKDSQGKPTWGPGSTESSTLRGKPNNDNHERQAHYTDICRKCGARRIDQQIGLEKTPEEFVAKMVEVFREVRRVLRGDGTCWVNIGDSYNANQGSGFDTNQDGGERKKLAATPRLSASGLKAKNLVGVPWRLAFALQADGWYLRSEIIWHKPNPMPESVTDRPTKAHEQVFLLTKAARYFYDAEAIKEGVTGGSHPRTNGKNSRMVLERAVGREQSKPNPSRSHIPGVHEKSAAAGSGIKANESFESSVTQLVTSRNRRSVWTIATQAYPEAHFATYPVALVEPCIKAGTSERGCCAKCGKPWERVVYRSDSGIAASGNKTKRYGQNHTDVRRNGVGLVERHSSIPWNYQNVSTIGWQPACDCNADTVPCTVLDPFAGSGTTLQVARILGRHAIGIELNPEYAKLAKVRAMSNYEGNDDTRPLFEPKKPRQLELIP